MADQFNMLPYSKLEENRIIFSGPNLENVIIDEDSFPANVNEVILSSPRPINVILQRSNNTTQLNYVILADTKGKIVHLLGDQVTKFERIYRLEEGVEIHFATPDFNRTNRDVHVQVDLVGVHAKTNWFLSALVDQKHSKIYNISFLHKQTHTTADMKNFGVIIDDSKLIFSGTSAIFENMSKAETHQTAKIIIFDDKAIAKADPILAIHHNDVAASHAATVGKVNSDHMFYMQSRGISELDTKRLITKGYLEPVIKFIDDPVIARRLRRELEEVL